MSSVNISLTKEAYGYLKLLKGREKSFSDVVMSLKERNSGKKGSKEAVMKYFGAFKDMNIDWKVKGRRMKDFRNEVEERFR